VEVDRHLPHHQLQPAALRVGVKTGAWGSTLARSVLQARAPLAAGPDERIEAKGFTERTAAIF
jgi:hypothetical protein